MDTAGIDLPNDGSTRLLATDVRPALVLSGGGLLGAVQVGVLKALFQGGLRTLNGRRNKRGRP